MPPPHATLARDTVPPVSPIAAACPSLGGRSDPRSRMRLPDRVSRIAPGLQLYAASRANRRASPVVVLDRGWKVARLVVEPAARSPARVRAQPAVAPRPREIVSDDFPRVPIRR